MLNNFIKMEIEEKNILEILNILLKDSGKNISSLEKLSDFNYLEDIIKSM